jgi:hypothetical protein
LDHHTQFFSAINARLLSLSLSLSFSLIINSAEVLLVRKRVARFIQTVWRNVLKYFVQLFVV